MRSIRVLGALRITYANRKNFGFRGRGLHADAVRRWRWLRMFNLIAAARANWLTDAINANTRGHELKFALGAGRNGAKIDIKRCWKNDVNMMMIRMARKS